MKSNEEIIIERSVENNKTLINNMVSFEVKNRYSIFALFIILAFYLLIFVKNSIQIGNVTFFPQNIGLFLIAYAILFLSLIEIAKLRGCKISNSIRGAKL